MARDCVRGNASASFWADDRVRQAVCAVSDDQSGGISRRLSNCYVVFWAAREILDAWWRYHATPKDEGLRCRFG
jgi:hypothetical protein